MKGNVMNTTQNNVDYMQRLVALGLMEGIPGDQKINANVTELFNALHHVLAGGEVKVTIEKEGNPAIVAELENKQTESLKKKNFFKKNFLLSFGV